MYTVTVPQPAQPDFGAIFLSQSEAFGLGSHSEPGNVPVMYVTVHIFQLLWCSPIPPRRICYAWLRSANCCPLPTVILLLYMQWREIFSILGFRQANTLRVNNLYSRKMGSNNFAIFWGSPVPWRPFSFLYVILERGGSVG